MRNPATRLHETRGTALTTELLNVVEETMQPTQASLWLRPSQAPSAAAGAGVARQPR
jgi:hypothetical protein